MRHPLPSKGSSKLRVLFPAIILAALIPALGFFGGLSRDDQPAATGSTAGDAGFTGESLSLGDWITRASAIVTGTVDEVGSPYWNSEDGTDWSEEWAADPHSFDVTPVAVFPLTIGVDSVLAAPGEGPVIAAGQKVEVVAPQSTGSVGGKFVFFLYWGKLYLNDGSAQSLWVADLTSGLWTVNSDGTVSPNDVRIAYSLITADIRGAVHLRSNQQGPPAIAFGELADIIQAELATPRVDVAGFDRWPWEVAYRRLQEQNDLPEELLPTPPPGYDTGEEP
jgi:hypothetical protein